jgi:hypothetical protein
MMSTKTDTRGFYVQNVDRCNRQKDKNVRKKIYKYIYKDLYERQEKTEADLVENKV